MEDEPVRRPAGTDDFKVEWWGSFKNGALVDELNHSVSVSPCHLAFDTTATCTTLALSSLPFTYGIVTHHRAQFKPICKGWLLHGRHAKYHAFDEPCSCKSKCTVRCAQKCRAKGKLLSGHSKWNDTVQRHSVRLFTDNRTLTNAHKLSAKKGARAYPCFSRSCFLRRVQ